MTKTEAAAAPPAGALAPVRRTRSYDRAAVVATVAARLAHGEKISEIFNGDTTGLPARSAFLRWIREDEALGRAYFAARRQGGARGWMTPGGARPTAYRDVYADIICTGLADGRSLRSILAAPGMPAPATVARWMARYPAFGDEVRAARGLQADMLFDKALEVAEDATEQTWRSARLHVETLRWVVARLAPRKYGAKATQSPMDGPPRQAGSFQVLIQKFARKPGEPDGEIWWDGKRRGVVFYDKGEEV